MRYRKKPVVIDAWQWKGKTVGDLTVFLLQTGLPWHLGSRHGLTGIIIPTLEGEMLAECGDWVIKGVNGEFYPCKPDTFAKTYEEVEDKP